MLDTLVQDIRYALRGLRRAPLFAATASATIGLGLGILCSAFTIVNAYFLRPIDLPDPQALVGLSWDTQTVRRQRFTLSDFEDLRNSTPHFAGLAAGQNATAMRDGNATSGLLVTGDYFTVLGARAALGRTLRPDDGLTSSAHVVVLSDTVWRSRFGADRSIVGTTIPLGRLRFEVVGVMPPDSALPGQEIVGFWAPLAAAPAFLAGFMAQDTPRLSVVGRLKQHGTEEQVRTWLRLWLEQRLASEPAAQVVAVNVDSLATRIPLTGKTLAMFVVILSAFGLVLLVACANVTNLMLARALSRQREMAVKLSLGSSRWRVARQLIVESLVLAAPAAVVGFALTLVTARVFPALIVGTFPAGVVPVEGLLVPLDPNLRVVTLLCVASILSATLVSLAPAARMARLELARAARGEAAWDTRRSRLRTGLVAMQIGACVLFLVGATSLVDEARRLATPDSRLSYERVADVRVDPKLRAAVAARLGTDPAVERVAAAWQPPLVGRLQTVGVVASETRVEKATGLMVVSPEYFSLFDIRVTQGRGFTTLEGDEGAPVALVSASTARALWPGMDPIGRTLEVRPAPGGQPERLPPHTSVRVIGVVEDVGSGSLLDGPDATCVYFTTSAGAPGAATLLVRGRSQNAATLRAAVAAAVNAVERDAPFQFFTLPQMVGTVAWIFGAFSAAASLLGAVGLLLAFSGTYAVVSFLVSQRTREFGVRMALGATVPRIVSGMLTETLRTAAMGLAGGLAVAMALARALASLTNLAPLSGPRPYVIGTAIVLTSTLIAAFLPSLRASRIDPARALRVE